MSNVKSIIVCIFLSVFIVACASNTEKENNSYYGKWTLNKVVHDDGDFRDFTKEPGNFIHIKKFEISEIIAGHGVRTYNYIQKGNELKFISGSSFSSWIIVKNSENSMEIDTAIGRYVLTR